MSAAYAGNTSGIVELNAGNYRNHKTRSMGTQTCRNLIEGNLTSPGSQPNPL